MENKIIKKENGKITEGVREIISDMPYMTDEENCFKKEINQDNFENYNLEKVQLLDKQMDKILNDIIALNDENIIKLYNMIKSVNNNKDLEKVYKTFLVKYAEVLEEKYDVSIRKSEKIKNIIALAREEIESNFDIVISTIIKKIIEKYYILKLQNYKRDEINKLEDSKMKGFSIDYFFQKLGESFDEQSINNGVKNLSAKILLSTIDKIYDIRQKHLCWENCKNASPDRCEKVRDYVKRSINDYDFIIDGYQILDNNDKVDTFIVSECSNYEEQKPKKLSNYDGLRIRELKENIFMEYFEAETLEEARNIRNHMIKTNQIVKVKK